MAEKYGTVPKKFTAKWWEYFWMYYKRYIIILAIIVAITGITVFSKIMAPRYDLTLTYAGNNVYSMETVEKIERTLSPLCEDIDKNGKRSLFFSQLNFSQVVPDVQYMSSVFAKLNMAFAEDETYIFILDKDRASAFIGETPEDTGYAPLKDWLTADISNFGTLSAHGMDYGVDISNCEIFKDLGMDVSDHYLFIRYYPRKDQQKRQMTGYDAAIEFANRLLSEK